MSVLPRYSYKLRMFGEIGIVKELGIKGHTDNKGLDALFLGYEKNSTKGVYRMLNLRTWKVCVSRDITWLNINYKQYKEKQLEIDSEDD